MFADILQMALVAADDLLENPKAAEGRSGRAKLKFAMEHFDAAWAAQSVAAEQHAAARRYRVAERTWHLIGRQ